MTALTLALLQLRLLLAHCKVMALSLMTLLVTLTLLSVIPHLVVARVVGIVMDYFIIIIQIIYPTIAHYARFAKNMITLLLSIITSSITCTPMTNPLPYLLMLLFLSILMISLGIPLYRCHTLYDI